MYQGFHPDHSLELVEQRQKEIRARSRRGNGLRSGYRRLKKRMPVAFKLGRLHVMLWLDGAHKT